MNIVLCFCLIRIELKINTILSVLSNFSFGSQKSSIVMNRFIAWYIFVLKIKVANSETNDEKPLI